jgi:biopolymer transport protein ExbB/biopolymer transport protein TolQ
MQIDLAELWVHMGWPVRAVVLLLTAQAVACVAVVLDRSLVLMLSGARARAFAATVQPALEAGELAQVVTKADASKNNHLSAYLAVGLRTFIARRAAGDSPGRAAELTRRALDRKGDAVSRDLNRGMNILASTGSTAPFVGLLGTVLGIINAFKLISQSGSGGIGTIGGAIAEALVVTGYGLVVAIPSVLLFNYITGKIAAYEAGLLNAGAELIDRLETLEPGGNPPAKSSEESVAEEDRQSARSPSSAPAAS